MISEKLSAEEKEEHKIDLYVGQRIREKRLKAGLTLSFVAKKLGVSLQTVQKYEQGNTRVSASTMYKLCRVFSVQSNYFFEGIENQKNIDLNFLEDDVIQLNQPRTLNILLIEDDPSDEFTIRKALDSCTSQVDMHCVHDGSEAISFLKRKETGNYFPRPDVILLDLFIPKVSGFEVLKEIKRDYHLKDIPVIVLSNSISMKDMMRAYKNYASGYVCKPFNVEHQHKKFAALVEYWSDVVILPQQAA